ncbi:triokinase/FMN cyclase-like isoform X1 [Tachypleus tridentatus]|uniref:triokinase/FMN cyclase-like isoform X1 n=2 Tax=Tachypleus tridentatus TaxID=6853 RepID=UPI003FD074CD
MSSEGRFKKLINSPNNCVYDNLLGITAIHPGLRLINNSSTTGGRVVIRHDFEEYRESGKVTLVSGGGSGHEPFNCGFVGPGMLTAVVPGEVFTSPSSEAILMALSAVGSRSKSGTLIIAANYTGDRLNFGSAVEKAKLEGLNVEMIVVGEDCALQSSDKSAGRRGLCGTVLMFKIAGALAEAGKSLKEIYEIVKHASENSGTIGISLTPCSIPGSDSSFSLGSDEMELGLGVHGEAGVMRLKVMPAQDIVKKMVDHMTNPESASRLNVKKGDSVAVVINNLGGTSQMEMNIVAKETISYLELMGLLVERVYVGTLMSSLEMAGVSITILKLTPLLVNCLDAPTSAYAWPNCYLPAGAKKRFTPEPIKSYSIASEVPKLETKCPKISQKGEAIIRHAVSFSCSALVSCEKQLNCLDREGGDGDCGSTLCKGAQAILDLLEKGLELSYPSQLLLTLGSVVERSMGGTSGAIYSLFFTGAAKAFIDQCTANTWCYAVELGMQAIMKYSGAEPGDRTMVSVVLLSLISAQLTLGVMQ